MRQKGGKPRYWPLLMGGGLLDHRMHAREARNAGEAMRVAIFTSGCSSNEPASEALDNNYSNEPSLGQEYQIIAQINSDYAYLLHTLPPDYDLLATEGKSVCQNMPH